MIDDYKTSLTQNDFKEAFKKVNLTKNEKNLLQTFYDLNNHKATGVELTSLLGKNHVGGINLTFSNIAEKISKVSNVYPLKRDNGKYRWWSLLAIGEQIGKLYSWQLRPEIVEVIEELNIINGNKSKRLEKEKRIARMCWNSNNWEKPSGNENKSLNADAYENFAGFGWEEWLFDTKKQINGYHYGFIQAINNNWSKYQKQIMEISLFSIDGETKYRWWIGKIAKAEIITEEEAKEVTEIYRKKGWLNEMKEQVSSVKGDITQFQGNRYAKSFFNLKYKIHDLKRFENPIKLRKDDNSIRATYLSTLYHYKEDPKLESETNNEFLFKAGHNQRKEKTFHTRRKLEKEVKLFHNQMQNFIFKQLVSEYGKENISTEQDTGLGSKIDIAIKRENVYTFYELKGYNTIQKCIREAVSQLMEYAFYPNTNRANELVIVSHNPIDKNTKRYLKKLRDEFRIPIYYQQYNIETQKLNNEKY
jgi:hypothetical protein